MTNDEPHAVAAGLIRGPGLCEELTGRHRIIQNEKSTRAKPRFIRGGIPANEITSLDAAMTIQFHIASQWRGASEFLRQAAHANLHA